MDVSFYTLRSDFDGLGISVAEVSPDSPPVALVQLAHGMCGSKDRFLPFMQYMAERGVASIANDHRGHGASVRNEDDLGYMYDGGQDAMVDDMRMVSDHIKKKYPDLPLYVVGHSMGSLVLRAYMKKYADRLEGAVLCGSPGYSPAVPVGYALADLMCRLGFGHRRPAVSQKLTSDMYNRPFSAEGDNAWICSDQEARQVFSNDPKHNFRFTYNGSRCLMGLMQQAYSCKGWLVRRPDLPVLFLAGEDDSCAGGPSGVGKAAAVMHEAGYRCISIKIYPAMRHEVLNEVGKERVWRDIMDFIGVRPICRP